MSKAPILILLFGLACSAFGQSCLQINKDPAANLARAPRAMAETSSPPGPTDAPVLSLDNPRPGQTFDRLTDVRTIYVVVSHATGAQDYAPLLGDGTTYDFHGAEGSQLF